jgi:hypothetical protein
VLIGIAMLLVVFVQDEPDLVTRIADVPILWHSISFDASVCCKSTWESMS